MGNSIAKKMPQMLGMMLLILIIALAGVASASAGKPTVEGDAAVTATPEVTDESTAAVTATAEAVDNCTVRAVSAGVAIRVGPGTQRSVRAALPLNLDVPVTGQAQDKSGNRWYNVHLPNVTTELDRYWVAATDVKTSGDCTQVAQVPASPIIAAAAQTVSYPSQTIVVEEPTGSIMSYLISLPMVVHGVTSDDPTNPVSLNAAFAGDFYVLNLKQPTMIRVSFGASQDPSTTGNCTLEMDAYGGGYSLNPFNIDLTGDTSVSAEDQLRPGIYDFNVGIYPDDADCAFHYTLTMTGS